MKRFFGLFVFSSFALACSAQFFQGFGVMGGLTLAREKWWTTVSDGSSMNTTKEKHKFLLRFNGELYAEFVKHPNFRWRTEFEYNMKGTKHKVTGDKNKVDYISWNNYLVIRQEDFLGTPYFLVGPRVEYLFRQATPSIPYAFEKIHFSWLVGLGWEFVAYGLLKPLVEVHYNPDFNMAVSEVIGDEDSFAAKNRAWELRVGFKIDLGYKTKCPPVLK